MYGPTIIFDLGEYASFSGGAVRTYFALIPFAPNVKSLWVSLVAQSLDANGLLEVFLEHSLDGMIWEEVEALNSIASGGAMTEIKQATKDFAPLARLRLEVSDSTLTNQLTGTLEVRAAGKPF